MVDGPVTAAVIDLSSSIPAEASNNEPSDSQTLTSVAGQLKILSKGASTLN